MVSELKGIFGHISRTISRGQMFFDLRPEKKMESKLRKKIKIELSASGHEFNRFTFFSKHFFQVGIFTFFSLQNDRS
jgi:hypothetical protein